LLPSTFARLTVPSPRCAARTLTKASGARACGHHRHAPEKRRGTEPVAQSDGCAYQPLNAHDNDDEAETEPPPFPSGRQALWHWLGIVLDGVLLLQEQIQAIQRHRDERYRARHDAHERLARLGVVDDRQREGEQ